MSAINLGFLLSITAASATLLGWLLIVSQREISKRLVAIVLLLVAGAMISVSALQLIPNAAKQGLASSEIVIWLCLGILLVFLLSHFDKGVLPSISGKNRSALITALAISLHNFPEGVAPITATLIDTQTGVTTAIVLGLHNIPEGLAIAATAILAGLNKFQSFLLTLAATLAEIFGASLIFFGSAALTDQWSARLLALVAGIMLTISAKELIPFSVKVISQSRTL